MTNERLKAIDNATKYLDKIELYKISRKDLVILGFCAGAITMGFLMIWLYGVPK